MRSGIKDGVQPPSSSGKIIPSRRSSLSNMPDWEMKKKPRSIDPDKIFSVDSIPDLFRTVEVIMKGLDKLNVEFCIGSERLGEIWLVPAYTTGNRREISFEDAAKITAIVSALGGEVKEFKFLDEDRDE